MEQALKERHFQEQKQRLKEMSAIGARHVNADSLIQSIIGKPEPRQVRPAKPVQQTQQQPIPSADEFGDFMTGPASPKAEQTTSANQIASSPPANQIASSPPANQTSNPSASQSPGKTANQNQATEPTVSELKAKSPPQDGKKGLSTV